MMVSVVVVIGRRRWWWLVVAIMIVVVAVIGLGLRDGFLLHRLDYGGVAADKREQGDAAEQEGCEGLGTGHRRSPRV